MANKLPAFDKSLFEWKTLKSKNGASYRVGREKVDGVREDLIKANKQAFGMAVDWTVGGGWKDTSDAIARKTGISAYKLWQCNTGTYDYCLQFRNTETYDYYFSDKTGDRYEVNTWLCRSHYVEYNSDQPDINYVSGS